MRSWTDRRQRMVREFTQREVKHMCEEYKIE